ncbi:selenide, water dikinase SelD [Helicobacter equorum]|uniref:selenide, water dikinase SelD n=1 Tax=Helicobacter equorum TaxID=361872 RepID=UPI000CF02448|nr:selenide, water dikinase SelD [Helicobacter equorum]
MGPEDLRQITSLLKQPSYEELLIGFEDNEDCGAFVLDSQHSGDILLNTADFITPIVDDPYIYGQIAAANSLSDVFAMGGRALSALNLFMWDSAHVSKEMAREILEGGLSKITESHAILLGGHTTRDSEQKYGLSVTGMVESRHLWRNNTAQIGDLLVLCKPIGSGIVSTGLKARVVTHADEMIQSLCKLNMYATQIARQYEIHACTDITGFGLIGHVFEMCSKGRAEYSVLLYSSDIPCFSQVHTLSQEGIIPGGTYANKEAFTPFVSIECDISDDSIFYDVQTSGGLLFAVPMGEAKDLVYDLRRAGYEYATIIGEILPKRHNTILLG